MAGILWRSSSAAYWQQLIGEQSSKAATERCNRQRLCAVFDWHASKQLVRNSPMDASVYVDAQNAKGTSQ